MFILKLLLLSVATFWRLSTSQHR